MPVVPPPAFAIEGTTAFVVDKWYTFGAAYDGASMKLYVGG